MKNKKSTSLVSFAIIVASLFLTSNAMAAINGPSGVPWVASADTVNAAGHTGIVVTDVTQSACQLQFNNAMINHAAAHGDVFSNIKNCQFLAYSNPSVEVVSALSQDLTIAVGELENEFSYTKFLARRKQLIKRYTKALRKEAKKLQKSTKVKAVKIQKAERP